LGNVHRADLPNCSKIDIAVIVRDDIPHSTHLSKRQLRNCFTGQVVEVGRGLSDDFEPADYGILLFCIGQELGLGRVG